MQACEMSAIVGSFEHFLALPFFEFGMKIDLFEFCASLSFKFADMLSVALSKHYLLGFEIAQLKSHHLH